MLGIVIVIYKSFDQILAYVRKELPKISLPWRAVIVDVGCTLESSKRIAEALNIPLFTDSDTTIGNSSVVLLHCKDNLGYARGNNLGTRFLLKNQPDIDKLLISNDDIELLDANVVDVMASRLDSTDELAVIGPGIINLKDQPQPPFFAAPDPWYLIRRNIGIPFLGHDFFELPWDEHCPTQNVYAVSGCFFMIRASDFLAIGMFDERTFLYWEENILGMKLLKSGKKTLYDPSVRIRHFVGNTTGSVANAMLLVKNELAGQKLFFSDYCKITPLTKLILSLSAVIRLTLVRMALFKHTVKTRLMKGTSSK